MGLRFSRQLLPRKSLQQCMQDAIPLLPKADVSIMCALLQLTSSVDAMCVNYKIYLDGQRSSDWSQIVFVPRDIIQTVVLTSRALPAWRKWANDLQYCYDPFASEPQSLEQVTFLFSCKCLFLRCMRY